MEFHISCHHTPINCGGHRLQADRTRSPNTVPNWAAHCEMIGSTYNKGSVNPPQHDHFMFVETDNKKVTRFNGTLPTLLGYHGYAGHEFAITLEEWNQ